MAINFSVVPEPETARVAIQAENGVPGDSFYLLRRDRNGSRLVRETSEAGVVWQSDPSSLRTNYASNPSLETNNTGWSGILGINSISTVKNHATNPNMVPATANAEYGRNRVTNPRFVGGSAGVPTLWSSYSYLTTTTGSRDNTTVGGKVILTAAGQAAGARYGLLFNGTSSGNANVPVTCKIKYQNTGADSGLAVVMWLSLYSGGTLVSPTDGSHMDYATDDEGELVVSIKPTANFDNIKYYVWIENRTASTISGATEFTVWDPIVSSGYISWNQETTKFFAGDSDPDADSTYSWAGTANASESIMTSSAVNLYVTSPSMVLGALEYNGQPTAAIMGGNAAVNDTWIAPQGDAGAIRLALNPGSTYTAKATLFLDAPQVGTLHANARRIIAYTRIGAGAVVTTMSSAAPNTAGTHDVSVTFTIPSTATEAYIRLYNGASLGNGVTFWSNLSVAPSSYVGPAFNGSNMDSPYVTYAWDGTANASSSTMTAINGRVSDFGKAPRGNYVMQMVMGSSNTGGDVGIFYTETVSGVAGDVWSMRVEATAFMDLAIEARLRFRNGTTTVNESILPVTLDDAGYGLIKIENVAASGTYTNIQVWLVTTSRNWTTGEWMRADALMLEKKSTIGEYFDGSTDDPAYSGWNGTANGSTSWIAPSSLPITIYDYEARQGLETDYVLTDEMGNVGGSYSLTIPSWGTWLKDPFRPYNNIKVYWNQDDSYTRKARRELFIARGAKYPVPHWDKRMAPEGGIRVATETLDQALDLTTMLNAAGVIMIDTPLEFGVPIRYVSVGDITGSRAAADKEKDLGWEARYWTLQVDEVDYPVGSPLGQGITYEDVSGRFDSYLALATSVETYEDLASGNWGE